MECAFFLRYFYSAYTHIRDLYADSDFLECWERMDKTILFDAHWVMSSQWLHVTARPLPSAWTYGDVSCTSYLLRCYKVLR